MYVDVDPEAEPLPTEEVHCIVIIDKYSNKHVTYHRVVHTTYYD